MATEVMATGVMATELMATGVMATEVMATEETGAVMVGTRAKIQLRDS